jgi:hypothetical protein
MPESPNATVFSPKSDSAGSRSAFGGSPRAARFDGGPARAYLFSACRSIELIHE